jgi:flavin reductase (DIM6/NTAB) family NADH-FMN oxidoreductase RutF
MFYDDPKKHNLKHNPFKALIAPRPIAWVSSVDSDGVPNLAPFSFFNAISDAPPMIVFAPNGLRPTGHGKDTLRNILQTNEFVVNLSNWALREAMNTSSADVGPEVDEFELAGVTAIPSTHINVPRVKEAPASLECRLLTRISLPSTSPKTENNIVIGEVVGIHIDDAIIKDGMIDTAAYHPLARHGYMGYSAVDSVFEMLRPKV